MASPARLEIFFGVADFGWSTDHYYQTQLDNLSDMAADANALVLAYANCLAYGIRIDAARGSLNGVWRDSLFFQVPIYSGRPVGPGPYTSQAYNFYTGNGPSGDPFDGINFRLEMGAEYRASEIISGLPSGALQQPSIYPWSGSSFATTYTQIQALMNVLVGTNFEGVATGFPSKWGGLVRAKGPDGPTPIDIASVTCITNGVMLVTTSIPHGLSVGDPVRILGVTQPGNQTHVKLNGTYNVGLVVSSVEISITNPQILTTTVAFATSATIQLIELVLQRYTKWNFVNQTHRKRGRRFGAPRGRLKRRAQGAVV